MARRTGLGTCVRCWRPPRPAATVERLSFGDSEYELPVCDGHADDFRRDMYAWSRLGIVVDDDANVSFKAKPPVAQTRNLGKLVVSHLNIPAPGAPPEPAPVPAPRPQPRLDTRLPFNAERWTWSNHAIARATLRQLAEDDVLWCAEHPDLVRPGRQPGTLIHKRGHVKVVVDPQTYEILTVSDTRYEDNDERELENAS